MKRAHLLRSPASRWALAWLGLVALAGTLAPWLPLPYGPAEPDLLHLAVPPGWRGPAPHYLGTDPLGRDVLAGLVFGARQLLVLSVPATMLATVAGAALGGAAGYWGNRGLRLPWPLAGLLLAGLAGSLHLPVAAWGLGLAGLGLGLLRQLPRPALPLDALVQTGLTLLGTVPRLLLVLALASGPPLPATWLLGLLALLAWPDTARLVRSQMRQVRTLPFVEATRALGLPGSRVWWRHALPAACRPLAAFTPLALASLISLESTLAFLGVGGAPTTASWGQLLGQFRQEPGAWWLVAVPGLSLLFTLLALQQLAHPPGHRSQHFFED